VRAGKGYCLAQVEVFGREGHSAYPALGASAIFRAARLIERIEMVAARLKDERHEAFDPPYTTLNVGLIEGGTAKNIIAGSCRFTLEWRPVPGQAASRAVEVIKDEAELLRAADEDFDYRIEVQRLDEGTETRSDAALVSFMEKTTGKAAGTVAFGTEAPQLIELGAEAVVFGAGDIRNAHRTGEFVPVAELERCVEVLALAIKEFCL
jgi:acetylornithine deacetylase